MVNVHEGFCLYLLSPYLPLDIPRGILSLLNIVDFSVSLEGLKEQLQTQIIKFERPELEDKKHKLVKSVESLQLELYQVKESLLNDLSNAQGSILDNIPLIKSLENSKEKSIHIGTSLEATLQLEKDLDSKRTVFGAFAKSCSRLFFTINSFHQIRAVYQWDLPIFTLLLEKAMKICKNRYPQDEEARIQRYPSIFGKIFYGFIMRSIYAEDQRSISLSILKSLFPEYFPEIKWNFFEESFEESYSGSDISSCPDWVPSNRRGHYAELKTRLSDTIGKLKLESGTIWNNWISSNECEKHFPNISFQGYVDLLRCLYDR